MSFCNSSISNLTKPTSIVSCEHLQFCLKYNESSAYIETVVIFLTTMDVFLLISTLLCNGLFLLSFYLYENLRTPSNILLLNLAVVDSTFGTLGLGACGLFQLKYISCQSTLCFFKDLYVHFFGTGMIFTLTTFTVVSIERFVCIFYALRWEQISTKRRAVAVVVSTWIFWVGLSTSLRATGLWSIFENIFLIFVIVSILILLITNATILKEIRRHEKRIAQDELSSNSNSDVVRKAREKKRAKTVILMIALVFLCYLPSIFLIMASKIPSVDQVQLQFGWMTCRTLSLSHSTFDIVVYGMRTEEIKQAFKKVLRKLRCLFN